MDFNVWIQLLLATIVISVSPGAGAVTTMDNGMTYGFKRSYSSILGLQAGLLAQTLIVAVGLGGILAASSTLYEIVKWIGVLYLVYIGIMKFKDSTLLGKSKKLAREFSFKRSFINAFLVNITNPKATIFLIAFLPLFIDQSKPKTEQFIVICFTLITVDMLVMSGYSSLAQLMRKWMNNPKIVKAQNRITGSLLILIAIFLATSENGSEVKGN
ncbi:MAG: LysE family transporter [Campylobacteraceae bacterium]